MRCMVIVIQHEPLEGPGTLHAALPPERRLVRTFAGEAVPRDIGDARGLVVLGGGMGVYEQDRLPHLGDEIALLQSAVRADRPVLGICLGSQLLAAALGGEVAKTGFQEIGFYRVRLSDAAASDELFAGAPRDFVAFHWHGDAFTLPPGAVPLASTTMTPLQAFRFGHRAWGVQFHLETDAEVLQAMAGSGELSPEEAEPILAAGPRELPRLAKIAEPVFAKWAALLQ